MNDVLNTFNENPYKEYCLVELIKERDLQATETPFIKIMFYLDKTYIQ